MLLIISKRYKQNSSADIRASISRRHSSNKMYLSKNKKGGKRNIYFTTLKYALFSEKWKSAVFNTFAMKKSFGLEFPGFYTSLGMQRKRIYVYNSILQLAAFHKFRLIYQEQFKENNLERLARTFLGKDF